MSNFRRGDNLGRFFWGSLALVGLMVVGFGRAGQGRSVASCEATQQAMQSFRAQQFQRRDALLQDLHQLTLQTNDLYESLKAREGQKVKDLSREKAVLSQLQEHTQQIGDDYFAMADADEIQKNAWADAFRGCGWNSKRPALNMWWDEHYELMTTVGAVVGQYAQPASQWRREWSELERGGVIPAGQFEGVAKLRSDFSESEELMPALFHHVEEAFTHAQPLAQRAFGR